MPDLTKQEVHDAADEVDRAGGQVGPRPVHKLLNRGSFSTISKFLESWVPKPPPLPAEPSPVPVQHAIERMGTQLWEIAFATAQEQSAERRVELEAKVTSLQRELGERNDDLKAAVGENLVLLTNVEKLNASNQELVERCSNLTGQLTAMREMAGVRRKPGPKPKTPRSPSRIAQAGNLATS